VRYDRLDSGDAVTFLDWTPSFWGDLAYAFGGLLLDLGADGLVHAGAKVASVLAAADDKRRSNTWSPQGYWVIDESSHREHVQHVELALGDVARLDRTAPHVSLPNPLDEGAEWVHEAVRRTGAQTFDCEGALFAKAAAERGRPFDALYLISDYVPANAIDGVISVEVATKGKLEPIPDERRRPLLAEMGKLLLDHLAQSWTRRSGSGAIPTRCEPACTPATRWPSWFVFACAPRLARVGARWCSFGGRPASASRRWRRWFASGTRRRGAVACGGWTRWTWH